MGAFFGERQLAQLWKKKCDLLSCQKGRAGTGRRDQEEDSLELAWALEERSGDSSGTGRVKDIPKIAQPKPKPASQCLSWRADL